MNSQDSSVKTRHILIVDDDQAIRESLSLGLELDDVDLTITTAHNAVTGLQSALAQIPDVAIIDMHMPYGTGLDLVTKLKSDPMLSRTKVIILTAQDSADNMWASMETGVDVFMSKPFNWVELESNVRSLLDPPIID